MLSIVEVLPQLPPNTVLVMDNATSRQARSTAYSPDLNPIERKWAQSKAIRKQKHCSGDELFSLYAS